MLIKGKENYLNIKIACTVYIMEKKKHGEENIRHKN
jgi:hypothetical protein